MYRARQLVFGEPLREIAIKVFDGDAVDSTNWHDIFRDAVVLIGFQEERAEPEIARRIVQVYDIGLMHEPVESAYMSMQLVPGGKTLNSVVRQFQHGGIPVKRSIEYLLQLLLPLAWMHSLDEPVVHGDLKPDNVLLTPDDTLVLTDFGLAAHKTLGSIGGAVSYKPIEALCGRTIGPPGDVFCVGLIWYEMLTGRHAYQQVGLKALADNDSAAYIEAQKEARQWPVVSEDDHNGPADGPGRIVPASEINPELKKYPQLEAILNRCLNVHIDRRYATAGLLRKDLELFLTKREIEIIPLNVLPQDGVKLTQVKDNPVESAKLFIAQGKPAESLRVLDRSGLVTPEALTISVRALIALNRPDEARERIQKAMDRRSGVPEHWEALAEVYEAAGRSERAKSAREKARELRGKQAQGR